MICKVWKILYCFKWAFKNTITAHESFSSRNFRHHAVFPKHGCSTYNPVYKCKTNIFRPILVYCTPVLWSLFWWIFGFSNVSITSHTNPPLETNWDSERESVNKCVHSCCNDDMLPWPLHGFLFYTSHNIRGFFPGIWLRIMQGENPPIFSCSYCHYLC